MKSCLRYLFFMLAISMLLAQQGLASNIFPLEPPDTSSPRATLTSFIHYTDKLYEAATAAEEDIFLAREFLQRAERCFDFSKVPPTLVSDVSIESVLRLREILDRIELPDMADVPDKYEVKKHKILLWRIPHTEITIGRCPDGPRMGAYLITPETVRRLEEYYNEVDHLPYRGDKGDEYTGFYEQYIYSSGWMIPDGFLKKLPEWMKGGYLGQAVWQWIALALIVILGGSSLWGFWLWHRAQKNRSRKWSWRLERLLFPLYAMLVCIVIEYIVDDQINITGDVLSVVTMLMELIFAVFAGVAIIIGGDVLMRGILVTAKVKEEALDADVIKLGCRLGSFVLVFVLFYNVGSYFGIPVTAIFASAGIAGMAIALAARETLANFFGGVSIFMDRPFRAGDYIVLDNGDRGEVKAVGMRSTKIQTRDDIMITIPNSVITNGKVVNQSRPHPHFRVRIKLGVAYGSDVDRVEEILMELAENNGLAISNPEPRVRFRRFGESSLEFELLCWAARPHDRGRLIHTLSRDIYKRFNKEGIVMPFPQQDVYLHKAED
ncbi:mechanosensitive ion channel family protein [Desulfovibrio sp. JC022]|uniref:mechanosensitive ion channel family protein n=1 Tax=Desulfovibrio sp. JC022 TaxID=2593642 RepID=UPI0013D73F99|nr:mechanosensitive ion channel family protein [Desulfovibrio sp. JC022]NDV22142.1 mechanosensitive ion channel family protein [Desulfovibrio sp. JC022]